MQTAFSANSKQFKPRPGGAFFIAAARPLVTYFTCFMAHYRRLDAVCTFQPFGQKPFKVENFKYIYFATVLYGLKTKQFLQN